MKYNAKTKIYTDGVTNSVYCNRYIFSPDKEREVIFENSNIQKLYNKAVECNIPVKIKKNKNQKARGKYNESVSREDNIKRAKDKIFDLVCCNNFKYFVTLTFNPELVDSFNLSECVEKTKNWLRNKVQRKGLIYIVVPELHPTSGRLHLHACFNDCLNLVDSGHKTIDHKIIYNLPEWEFGFSTAIKLTGSKPRVAWYVSKYITKDSKKLFGKSYWTSKNLKREPDTQFFNIDDFSAIQGQIYSSSSSFSYKYDLNFENDFDFDKICEECDSILEVLERIDNIV